MIVIIIIWLASIIITLYNYYFKSFQNPSVQTPSEKLNLPMFSNDHSSAKTRSTEGVGDENVRNFLPLSDNNVSTTNDILMERNWDIPSETDDINVS